MLAKILAGISAISVFAALWFRGSLANEKKERLEDELEITQESQELSDKAAEAVIRGLEDESAPIIRNNVDIS